jgi:tetratricopeptide (TPR) repeat protein
MEKIYRDYPDDLDAAAFYSLSLLGLVQPGEKGFRLQARAGAIALEVYQKNPNHPGAAHYIIHAFDDPDHAILALPAARRYAEIAPEAHHARHMPSHIFLQLGMWPEAAASNESAWETSDAWMKRKNLSPNVRDYHSLNWLLYVYLQQGRYRKAEELLTLMKQTMSESTYDNKLRPGYYENNWANMAAAFVIETERWKLAPTFFPQTFPITPISTSSGTTTHSGHGAAATESSSMTVRPSGSSQRLQTLVFGFAIAHGVSFSEGVSVVTGVPPNVNTVSSIGDLEVKALTLSLRNEHAQAIEIMQRAAALEEQMAPPSGPPALIKPTHELFGEILLRGGKPAEALEQFNKALLRQPNRARALLGAARAAMAKGDQQAARAFFAKLAEQWQQADKDLAELREVQDFLKN